MQPSTQDIRVVDTEKREKITKASEALTSIVKIRHVSVQITAAGNAESEKQRVTTVIIDYRTQIS